ncbi:MAG: S46 family peptidase, partial [Bacteroidia bacterium]|nr:S46 family peptidase [Bacteroidia bacterium]
MRKLSLLLIAALLVSVVPVKADEGMWMLPLLEKLNIKKMHDMGCKLTAEEIYSINNSSLKDAIVHFGGGCTGEIVSDKGLLFTNHHCGYGAIQKLSSVEHDYLNDGYWAMNLNEELPAKGLSVTFIDKFVDVTDKVNKAMAKGKTPQEKDSLYRLATKKLCDEAVKKDATLNARVSSFYNNNAYYLITSRTFKDIRFVGAPPSSIGKFGADTDNWMWPRHTGDFSVFRIYADKN